MTMTIKEFEESVAIGDGVSYHYIEGDLTTDFAEVLEDAIDLHFTLSDIEDNETKSYYINNIDVDRIKHLAESDIKEWLIKHSDLSPDDMKEHFLQVANAFYKNQPKRFEVATNQFFNFINSYC